MQGMSLPADFLSRFDQLCPPALQADALASFQRPKAVSFRLNRLQGQTQAEIARRLGVSVTTVENHVRGALQRLAWARSGR